MNEIGTIFTFCYQIISIIERLITSEESLNVKAYHSEPSKAIEESRTHTENFEDGTANAEEE